MADAWLKIDGLNTQSLIQEYHWWVDKDKRESGNSGYNSSKVEMPEDAKKKVSAYRNFLHTFRNVGKSLAAQSKFFKH